MRWPTALLTGLLLTSAHFAQPQAQSLQAGVHTGVARLGGGPPLGDETDFEYGFWVGLQLDPRLEVIADWTRISRESFRWTPGGFPVGEDSRNRQIVDVTLRYSYAEVGGCRFFAELGGGSYWNNRIVFNPQGYPGAPEAGKESTRRNLWTLGVGVRRRLAPHMDGIVQGRFHNLSCDEDASRLLAGLMFTWN